MEPRTHPCTGSNDALLLGSSHHGPGRVVGVDDGDQLGFGGDDLIEDVEVDAPAVVGIERQFTHGAAHVERSAPYLAVTGGHHHDLIAGLEQRLTDHTVGLRSTDGDQHVGHCGLWVEAGDGTAESGGTVDFGIKEACVEERLDFGLGQPLTRGDTFDTTVGQVELDVAFVQRLVVFERKRHKRWVRHRRFS